MGLLRVASYNIHRCIGSDGQYRPSRIRDVLRAMDAEVIALQEVETGEHHGELLDYLVEDSDWQAIEGPTLQRDSGRYGNVLLTARPVDNQYLLDLSFKQREPRGAIAIDIKDQNNSLRVIATHLGLRPGERRAQTRQLLDWMGAPEAEGDTTSLLMGDLNEWFLRGRPLNWLRAHFGATPAPSTFPSRWPVFALDRIWVYPRHRLVKTEVMRTPLTRWASDHLPVVATLQLD